MPVLPVINNNDTGINAMFYECNVYVKLCF